jgi:hypothetical protein
MYMTQKDATDFKRKFTKNTPGETPNSSFLSTRGCATLKSLLYDLSASHSHLALDWPEASYVSHGKSIPKSGKIPSMVCVATTPTSKSIWANYVAMIPKSEINRGWFPCLNCHFTDTLGFGPAKWQHYLSKYIHVTPLYGMPCKKITSSLVKLKDLLPFWDN